MGRSEWLGASLQKVNCMRDYLILGPFGCRCSRFCIVHRMLVQTDNATAENIYFKENKSEQISSKGKLYEKLPDFHIKAQHSCIMRSTFH